jgi:hypothetical protein
VSIPDPTYPDFERPVKVWCNTCGEFVCGHYRGSKDFRGVLKHMRFHEVAEHPPYSTQLIDQLVTFCEELNSWMRLDGRVGRYEVTLF